MPQNDSRSTHQGAAFLSLDFVVGGHTGINKVVEVGLGFQMQWVLGVAFQ